MSLDSQEGGVMVVLGQKSHVSRRKVMTGNLPG